MTTYTLEKTLRTDAPVSAKVSAVANMFGLGLDRAKTLNIIERCNMDIEPGQVVYITGASGGGKSLLLRLIHEQTPEAFNLDDVEISHACPLVDCFVNPLDETLQWLSWAGMSDAFAILRRPEELSDGQRYRFRLAMALARKPVMICIDEFCATLDRVTAAVVAHNVRKFADRFNTTFVIATSHDDLLEDLDPDVIVVKHLGSRTDVYYPHRGRQEGFKKG